MKRLLPILLLLAAVACGDDAADNPTTTAATIATAPTTTTPPTGTTAATTTSTATGTTLEGDTVVITIDGTDGVRILEDGEVRSVGERIDVDLGDTVRLEVTLTQADEVHIHTYDLVIDVAPGVAATLEFVADIPGVFEVELEGDHTLLFELAVS